MIPSIRPILPKVAMGFFGGCGQNELIRVINSHDPEKYPEFYLGAFNTDAVALYNHFGRETPGRQANFEKWLESQRLTIEVIGDKVTRGKGAGGDPERGKRAAEESREAIVRFFENKDQCFVGGGGGGGTGTGAIPFAAELIKTHLSGNVTAWMVMPEISERRSLKASRAFDQLVALEIPVFQIFNDQLNEYLVGEQGVNPKLLTLRQRHQWVHEIVLQPLIWNFRETLHEFSPEVHNDENDYNTVRNAGTHPFIGVADIPQEQLESITATEILQMLSKPRLQDPQRLRSATICNIRVRGPLPHSLQVEVEELLTERFEIHRGIHNDSEVENGGVRITIVTNGPAPVVGERVGEPGLGRLNFAALSIVPKPEALALPEAVPAASPALPEAESREPEAGIAAFTAEPPASVTITPPTAEVVKPADKLRERAAQHANGHTNGSNKGANGSQGEASLTYLSNGESVTDRVPYDLFLKYNRAFNFPRNTTVEKFALIAQAIEEKTGKKVDFPKELRPSTDSTVPSTPKPKSKAHRPRRGFWEFIGDVRDKMHPN